MADVKKCRVNTGEKDGGPDRDRTDDLFHAMEARSQLRHRPTMEDNFTIVFASGRIRQTAGLQRIALGLKKVAQFGEAIKLDEMLSVYGGINIGVLQHPRIF